jgi:transketolase
MKTTVSPSAVRASILGMLYKNGASHLGSSMSAVEMLISMYSSVDCAEILEKSPDRSRIFVSKGHCAAATYATMAHFGLLPMSALELYHKEGTLFAGHVSHAVPYVEHSTGALGHGINVAAGCALGLKSLNPQGSAKVLTLCGDGEIQEGSVWEAVMFAAHHNLDNLFILIDNNRISSIKQTAQILDLQPLKQRFEAFGMNVFDVDGHDCAAILSCLEPNAVNHKPTVVICNTVKGKGVPFAEWDPVWHYRSLTEDLYNQAMAALP